jgi:hypothetical protein
MSIESPDHGSNNETPEADKPSKKGGNTAFKIIAVSAAVAAAASHGGMRGGGGGEDAGHDKRVHENFVAGQELWAGKYHEVIERNGVIYQQETMARARELAHKRGFRINENTSVTCKAMAGIPIEIAVDGQVVPLTPEKDYSDAERMIVRHATDKDVAPESFPQPVNDSNERM